MLESIQHWIEKTYRLEEQEPAAHYLIDHRTVIDFLGSHHPLSQAEEVVLVAGGETDYQLGLYLHPRILEENSGESPARRTHRWLTATEGVSHLLLVSHKLKTSEAVTQLELELQGEIDKFFFACLHAKDAPPLIPTYHLEREASLAPLTSPQKATYEAARRLAFRYCKKLEREYLCGRSYDGLFEELRHFYRRSHWEKLRRIGLP